ncbi:hypothetical protein CMV_030789 [Castanea mollissima]|uniref:Hexosyltransferase n=1 Tax=Castanea mollissima TaxID=60419 RepID=A0A8J4VC04_9ROSI|nr:hypothetical protein CMV_030789 [Castanea mollissima]
MGFGLAVLNPLCCLAPISIVKDRATPLAAKSGGPYQLRLDSDRATPLSTVKDRATPLSTDTESDRVSGMGLVHRYRRSCPSNLELYNNFKVWTLLGQEVWRNFKSESGQQKHSITLHHHKKAYATVLHSSEAYVCGAIALAQSIIQSDSTKDLVLLADHSISSKSIRGLRAAGWKIKRIKRIQSPFAEKDSYNGFNYSKLRIWQLIEYDKVIFIDADHLVLKNIDKFFVHPQVSAATNNMMIFNSGVMVIEPSLCMFKELLSKSFKLESYNGGEQGFLNEAFTWWHRLPTKLNQLKIFDGSSNENHEIAEDSYTMQYLGLKPWMCYKDYDCNWDKLDHHQFASDSAHNRWWQVFEAMPKNLQPHCGLTKEMDARIRKWRGIARRASLPDGHWSIKVEDPRQHHFVD